MRVYLLRVHPGLWHFRPIRFPVGIGDARRTDYVFLCFTLEVYATDLFWRGADP